MVEEDDSGITVRGAKMLGTSSIMADELIVGSIAPLPPGEERFAATFAVPLATKRVRLMSRKSYEASAGNGCDYPLAYHFDENDAVVWFEDVHVPWERVFTYGDVTAAHAIWHRTPAHSYHNYQSQIRFSVKLRFLVGLARSVWRRGDHAAVFCRGFFRPGHAPDDRSDTDFRHRHGRGGRAGLPAGLGCDRVGVRVRHTQYEMFYGGANRIVDANVYRKYDWEAAARLVDNALFMMPLPGTPRQMRLKRCCRRIRIVTSGTVRWWTAEAVRRSGPGRVAPLWPSIDRATGFMVSTVPI